MVSVSLQRTEVSCLLSSSPKVTKIIMIIIMDYHDSVSHVFTQVMINLTKAQSLQQRSWILFSNSANNWLIFHDCYNFLSIETKPFKFWKQTWRCLIFLFCFQNSFDFIFSRLWWAFQYMLFFSSVFRDSFDFALFLSLMGFHPSRELNLKKYRVFA